VFTPSDFAFARDGIAAEADSNEETVLICDLDLDDLHDARSEGSVTPRLDRRPDLFQYQVSVAERGTPATAHNQAQRTKPASRKKSRAANTRQKAAIAQRPR
jgi:hypothetical protein